MGVEINLVVDNEVKSVNLDSTLEELALYCGQRVSVLTALSRTSALVFFSAGRAFHLAQRKHKEQKLRTFSKWLADNAKCSREYAYKAIRFWLGVSGGDLDFDVSGLDVLSIKDARVIFGLALPEPAKPAEDKDKDKGEVTTGATTEATKDSSDTKQAPVGKTTSKKMQEILGRTPEQEIRRVLDIALEEADYLEDMDRWLSADLLDGMDEDTRRTLEDALVRIATRAIAMRDRVAAARKAAVDVVTESVA